MAEMGETTFKFRKFDKRATMTFRLVETREFKVRKWLALSLVKLACMILGCGSNVDNG